MTLLSWWSPRSARPARLPLDLESETWSPCPGVVRARRRLPGREAPTSARRDESSPWLAVSDEPEKIGPLIPLRSVLNRFAIPLAGGRARVRVLVYHQNGPDAGVRSYAAWFEGCRIEELRGVSFCPPHFRGSQFSEAAALCLAGRLPILPAEKGVILRRDRMPAHADPSRSFFGGLFEADLAGEGEARFVCACSDGDPTEVDGDPWLLPPNCGIGQNDLVGHARGCWPSCRIEGPLADGLELEATGDPRDMVQSTLGLCHPVGGDLALFRGSDEPPVWRANRGLYGVDQVLSFPLVNPGPRPAEVQGVLISLAYGQDQAGLPDSKLFGAFKRGSDVRRIEVSRDAHRASCGVELFRRTLPPGERAVEKIEFHMGAASSGPVGIFLQGTRMS